MDENRPQRKFDRYQLQLKARCIVAGKPTASECLVTEIGRGGVGLYLAMPDGLKIGQSLMLDIYPPERLGPVSVILKVSYCRELDDNDEFNYFAGGKMTYVKVDDREALLDYAYKQIFNDETTE